MSEILVWAPCAPDPSLPAPALEATYRGYRLSIDDDGTLTIVSGNSGLARRHMMGSVASAQLLAATFLAPDITWSDEGHEGVWLAECGRARLRVVPDDAQQVFVATVSWTRASGRDDSLHYAADSFGAAVAFAEMEGRTLVAAGAA